MAINKNALIRYQALDRCFRNSGRMYFWEDLLEECNNSLAELNPESNGIQRRQLFEDIRFMESSQSYGIVLERKRYGKRVFYRYEDVNFSINNELLSETELLQIKTALTLLTKFTGVPQFEWIQEMIPFIEQKIGLIGSQKEVISLDGNIDLKGIHFLTPLFNGIVNERVLEVMYRDFKSEDSYPILFHPYYLKQYNNRWFVFGYNEKRAMTFWNMALDRIDSIQETALDYQKFDNDWGDYFYDMIGVTKSEGQTSEEVMLLFTPEQAPYITTKPIHPSQKAKHTEYGLEVRIQVILNYELEKLILSYGESVKVIAPVPLKESIKRRLQQAKEQYLL